jgi:hypothetical protein
MPTEPESPQSMPWFLKKEFIKDRQQRPINHKDYDSTSLFIPEEEYLKACSTQKYLIVLITEGSIGTKREITSTLLYF